VVADHLALYVDKVFDDPGQYHGFPVMASVLFFTFQIYCDFSAYTDIARGASRVMGIQLMRNFNFPSFSRSIREFWTRWHISLSSWFRDYLYIPLGGNKTNIQRWCFNIMVVFVISGLWHGANWTFIVWGALHGIYLITGRFKDFIGQKYLKNIRFSLPRYLDVITVFLLVSFGWIFFRAKDLHVAFRVIKQSLSGWNWRTPGLTSGIVNKTNFAIIVISLIAMLIIEVFVFRYKGYQRFLRLNKNVRLFCYIILCVTIVTFGIFNSSKFIYFQF